MSLFKKSNDRGIPMPIVVSVIGLTVAALTFAESRALSQKDEIKLEPKHSCIACHTKATTLAKIADKAGDPMYLVRSGDLTRDQLERFNAGKLTLEQLQLEEGVPVGKATKGPLPAGHANIGEGTK